MNQKSQNVDGRKRSEVLTETVRDLFNTIDENDVLFRNDEGKWILGNREISEDKLKQYAEEAELILRLGFWKELVKCVKYTNNASMFYRAKTENDIIAGKLLLYLLKTFEDILQTVANLKK